MSTGTIISGFIISTIGFSFFVYGRKQRRVPQLAVGLFQMAAPLMIRGPLMLTGAAVLSVIALRIATDHGL